MMRRPGSRLCPRPIKMLMNVSMRVNMLRIIVQRMRGMTFITCATRVSMIAMSKLLTDLGRSVVRPAGGLVGAARQLIRGLCADLLPLRGGRGKRMG